MPDGQPDKTWTSKDTLIWLAHEMGQVRGTLEALEEGFSNHLSSHFKVAITLLAGIIAIGGTVIGAVILGLL